MLSKREVVLIIALVFFAGIVFTDFTRPKPIEAEVTNIVYDTLDAKIIKLSKRVDSIESKLRSMETSNTGVNTDVGKLRTTIKKLSEIQKGFSADISALQKDMRIMKEVQVKQTQLLK